MRVMQTKFGVGGNCFQACMATVFGCELEDFPHLFGKSSARSIWTDKQWRTVYEWAQARGFKAFWLDPDQPADGPFIERLRASGMAYIVTGKSPSGDYGHNVVMQGSALFHDPTGGSGIVGDPWLYIGFEAVRDPRTPAQSTVRADG